MTTTHAGILQTLADQLRPVFEHSPDGVYLWLDEANKVCNERLAALFGYSVREWCEAPSFLETFVAEDDRELYASNYQNTVGRLAFPVTFRFHGRHKDGSTFAAETDMIPLAVEGHAVAYHFVRRTGE